MGLSHIARLCVLVCCDDSSFRTVHGPYNTVRLLSWLVSVCAGWELKMSLEGKDSGGVIMTQCLGVQVCAALPAESCNSSGFT